MERWCGKVAVVTGASAGIGASIVKALAKNNLQVVGLARRQERVQEIADQMKNENGKVYAVKADITKEEDIKVAFEWIKKNLGGVDILINNAGILLKTMVKDGEHDKWKTMFDLNVLAMASCTRETLNSIKERGLDDGHIININSISGHRLTPRSGGVVYSSTKFAAKVLTEGLRLELANAKSKIRVTNISPGVVTDTEIFLGSGGYELYPDQLGVEALKPNDIANAVVYALSQPPTVLVAEIIVRPTGEGM
ncbi:dehydrogenase/reductase SDR family member 11-like [Lycorma delicatula]|uniref:dehydrogenase/reductase SDR family member 11-like n=1 Tax=Lycorma delicatula TaxID=130591 RepID=UPI003F50FDAF